jgi:hypothetical protein
MSKYDNETKAASLIQSLAHTLLQNLPESGVVFGSAAIALHGIDLDREIKDLDVFV